MIRTGKTQPLFSLRQKGSKGAETDYFIGTEKSRYFSTTFWNLPVSFPGSSGDCMGLLFVYTKTGYNYFFEFTQTKTPHDDQNKAALALVERLQIALEGPIQFQKQPTAQNKMFTLRTKTAQKSYETVEEMFVDIEKDMLSIFPIVEDCIAHIKQQYSQFKAHRLTVAEFKVITEKFAERIHRFENNYTADETLEEFESFLENFDTNDVLVYFDFLKSTLDYFNLKQGDARLLFTYRDNALRFTIGQRYAFYLNPKYKKGKFGILSKDKINDTSSAFGGKKEVPYFTYFQDFKPSDAEKQNILAGFESELKRSKKSSYRLHNSALFEAAIFNHIVGNSLEIKEMETLQSKTANTFCAPINQILYGPPGTGKTYHTVNKSLSILKSKTEAELELEKRDQLKKRYDDYVENGQIAFTTFHQSMSYEDFIEGIKPLKPNGQDKQVLYDVVPGLFKTLAAKALHNFILHAREEKKEKSFSFDEFHNSYLNLINQPANLNTIQFTTINDKELKLLSVNGTSIIVKFVWYNKAQGIEATQPFSVTKDKIRQLFEAGINPHEITNMKETFAPFFKHNLSVYYAVYKSFYDFVHAQGFDLSENEETSITLTEDFELLLDTYSLLTPVEIERGLAESQNYVLIIDEINRGNVSQIFGELITLIEDDKRLGKPEAIQVSLPYSKEKFGVPPNLYILGTMNTADRSVEALDTALRRRFSFTEMPPKYELKELQGEVYGYPLHAILKKLNQRIEILLNRDHLIGHSYFLNKTEATLQESFYKNIIPLLQEYFYNDYGKIGLILGKGFVREKAITVGNQKSLFADFDTKNEVDVVKSYELIPFNEVDFESAIQLLLV